MNEYKARSLRDRSLRTSLVPIPLVDLPLSEASFMREFLDQLFRPDLLLLILAFET